MATSSSRQPLSLPQLVGEFYPDLESLGEFTRINAELCPAPYREMLAHDHHMTVAVEQYYGRPVTVEVVQSQFTPKWYVREILLRLDESHECVQYGIVKIRLDLLPEAVREAILAERIPLGRILIDHNVMRAVKLHQLFQIEPGPELSRLLELPANKPCYGRTAQISVVDELAIELLEVLSPRVEMGLSKSSEGNL